MSQDAETTTAATVSTQHSLRALASRSLTLTAALVRILTFMFAAILIVHVVLTVASANPRNGITTFVADAANHLTLGLGNLFLPASASLQVILNYGLAAVVWLVIGIIVARILHALAP
jgi:hypothetical protein